MLISCETDHLGDTRYFNENNEWHRTDGPAKIWWDGECSWYLFGKLHRYYGEPNTISSLWWLHGKRVK